MRVPTDRSAKATDRVNMTPMIDVVFLLIIFFLVSSHLARRETRFPVSLSRAASSQPNNPTTAAVVITVDQNQQIRLGSRVVQVDQFGSLLDPAQPVRLRVDRRLTYATVEPVLRRLTRAGIDDVSLVTLGEEP